MSNYQLTLPVLFFKRGQPQLAFGEMLGTKSVD